MCRTVLLAALAMGVASWAPAAFLVQVDTDGADDGPFTPSPNFTFGGDTTTASSSVTSVAPLMPVGDSIFGGNGVNELDTYVYRYDPTSDADNLATGVTFLGVDLGGEEVFSTGFAGGEAGPYRVYAAWPGTDTVSGGEVGYSVVSGAASFDVSVDQNTANDPRNGFGDVWVLLGVIDYDGSSGILVTQTAGQNTFVSMRSAAVMFEAAVPEPSSLAVLALGISCGSITPRRRLS
ncbi:hypothetical protein [Botrimarina sp.]|uniref:hypothetical protein n=1 Tax=Botrimarina sp. TaxID=2795802 RepID=UPI0032EF7F2B